MLVTSVTLHWPTTMKPWQQVVLMLPESFVASSTTAFTQFVQVCCLNKPMSYPDLTIVSAEQTMPIASRSYGDYFTIPF